MSRNLSFLTLFFVFSIAQAQQGPKVQVNAGEPSIEFESRVVNCGNRETWAPIDTFFVFHNAGNAPLIIETCKPSSGACVARGPMEPVQPGDTAKIEMRCENTWKGEWQTNCTVTGNFKESPAILLLTGANFENYTTVRLSETNLELGKFQQGDSYHHEITVYNTGLKPLEFMIRNSGGHCIGYPTSSTTVAPGESGTVKLMCDLRLTGVFHKTIFLEGNFPEARIPIHLSGEVTAQPYYAPETPGILQSESFAKLEFDATEFDFGEVPDKNEVSHEFYFTNKGNVPLQITSVKGTGGNCICGHFPKDEIQPGARHSLSIKCISKPGRWERFFTLSDNRNSTQQILIVKGTGIASAEPQIPGFAAAGSSFTLSETSVNLDTLQLNSTVEKTIVITNTGSSVLKLSPKYSGVVNYTISKKELLPGEAADWTIRVATSAPGKASKQYTLMTDAAEGPAVVRFEYWVK